MEQADPRVFLVGATATHDEAIREFLELVHAPEWETDAPSGSEKIAEVMGRLCYRSFAPGLNPNVTKIREGNKVYLGNIINTAHGSVFEHALFNFIFYDVSRVFTHELVRHRPAAVSQESLRYVRLDKLRIWFPEWARADAELMKRCMEVVTKLEEHQIWMADHFGLDAPGANFTHKKHMTSFMRRFAPEGLATSIGWSANAREVRWFLSLRTDEQAEEEIRKAAAMVGEIMLREYPNFFQDFHTEEVAGEKKYIAVHPKI